MLYKHQFDLYGVNIRLQHTELARTMESRIINDKNIEIESLKERLEYISSDYNLQGELLDKEVQQSIKLRIQIDDLHKLIKSKDI